MLRRIFAHIGFIFLGAAVIALAFGLLFVLAGTWMGALVLAVFVSWPVGMCVVEGVVDERKRRREAELRRAAEAAYRRSRTKLTEEE